jgi:hypothetical protein
MIERGVTEDDVLATMAEPETSYPGSPGHPPGRRIAARGDTLVVYVEEPRTVVTVLSEHELWADGIAAVEGPASACSP